jgi:transforming growth factor-beta-induced protein
MKTTFRSLLFVPMVLTAALMGCTDTAQVSGPQVPLNPASEGMDQANGSSMKGMTIAEIVVDAATATEGAEFTTLYAALQAADPAVVEALSGKGQYTVFAPTDAAFDALFSNPDFPYSPEEVLGNQELLTQVLLYHVARGRRDSGDVLDSEQIRTMQRGFLYPLLNDMGAYIVDNSDITPDAKLGPIDIMASNGIIHVIDGVLLP